MLYRGKLLPWIGLEKLCYISAVWIFGLCILFPRVSLLGGPKSSFRFFCNILRKNPNELFSWPSSLTKVWLYFLDYVYVTLLGLGIVKFEPPHPES